MTWSQFQAILWLRWRLTRNQWSRSGRLNAVLAVILGGLGILASVTGAGLGFWLGSRPLGSVTPAVLLLVWDGVIVAFLFGWTIGIIIDIQRSESIDLGRLLHLPVSLKGVFLVNYLASHLTKSILLCLPAMLGLSFGLAWGRAGRMVLLVPAALSFVLLITAWSYCLQGWLVALMVNPRRRRAIIAGLTAAFILLAQLPNLFINFGNHARRPPTGTAPVAPPPTSTRDVDWLVGNRPLPQAVVLANRWVPFLWVANGAFALAHGKVLPSLLGTAGALGLGALGLRRAYRSTLRFYQGAERGRPVARPVPAKPPAALTGGQGFLELRLPGLPEEAVAMALASLRSMSRAPEIKMTLGSNLLGVGVIGMMVWTGRPGTPPEAVLPFIATGVVAFACFGLVQLLLNQFGHDRDGFRALVLAPAPRRYLLLGRNLAMLPLAGGLGLAFLALLRVFLPLPLLAAVAAGLQLLIAFFILSILGNLASVMMPFRVAAGGLKPTKAPLKTTLVIFLAHLVFPLAVTPIFVPPAVGWAAAQFGGLPAGGVNLGTSLLLAGVAGWGYWLTLRPLGRLLQEREQRILHVVTQEVE